MKDGRVAVLLGGGMGKMVCATSLIPKLKAKYGEVVVVNAYPEVFNFNPHISRNLTFNEKYLEEDYLHDLQVLTGEPYLTNEYRFERKHIIAAYCKLFGVEYTEDMKPELYLSPDEELFGWNQKQQLGKYILMHITGGTSYYSPQKADQKPVRSRDWPIVLAQEFVDKFQKVHPDVKVIQVGLQTEPRLKNVQLTNLPARMIFPLVKYADSFVGIDGFVNHVSAAFNKRGVVLWGGTDPKRLGYSQNDNMLIKYDCSKPFCHKTDYYSHLGGKEMSCANQYVCMQHSPEAVLAQMTKILNSGQMTQAVPVVPAPPETNSDGEK